MRIPVEFLRGWISSGSAIPSPGGESLPDFHAQPERKGLHSRFNPNLVGFGIANLFEPASTTPADSNHQAARHTSSAPRHREISE